MTTGLRQLVRPELQDLAPYSAASAERNVVRLHANESAFDYGNAMLNRYPEPQPQMLLERLAALYHVGLANVLATRGSDDAIDLLVRCFCRAGQDAVVICPPTFAMYAMAARLQNAPVIEVPLDEDDGFKLESTRLLDACGNNVRLVFICSPNNPTGNVVPGAQIVEVCRQLRGRALVVVDEAYIEFSSSASLAEWVTTFPNLVVLRTLSKAYGLAGARCGALVANEELTALVRPLMPPYPLPTPTIEAAIEVFEEDNIIALRRRLREVSGERQRLRTLLDQLASVRRTWPSEGNFILAEVVCRDRIIARCREGGVLIRALDTPLDRHVRITVGTPEQNARVVELIGATR